MAPHTWIAFFAAAWLISLSPGAGAVSCMAAGMRYGYRRAVWNIVGLQAGIQFVLLLVAAGLGALLATSETAFTAVKWVGALYLVWLGVQQWRAPATSLVAHADVRDGTPRELVLRGFIVNATNPKGILFMLAVLPQFIDPARPQPLQYAICGLTLLATDAVVMSGYTAFAARVLSLLRGARQQRLLNRTFGALFVAAGTLLATFKRAAI
ncbi:MAG TPA: homoserine/homoserine lactone efflux protein [Casimicrobiaceae bacterium]|nr:homoserine/homoserine lactone efflux protein [Casimicrobiaceae bacterium]